MKGDGYMTRFFAFLSCLVLLLGLCVGVSAAETDNTRASSVSIIVTVSNDGNCDVTTNVTLHVATPQKNLTYPVPANAANVTLNGKAVLTQKTGQARQVDISRILGGMTGDFSFSVGYSISGDVEMLTEETVPVTEEPTDATDPTAAATTISENRLRLGIPILAGFQYPIDELQFSINLPGMVDQAPNFVSGYHQGNIEKDLTYSIAGGNIAGRSWGTIKDHETLTVYLNASETMFPQSRVNLPKLETVTTLMGVCAGIALVYWLLVLRNYLPLRTYPAVAPEGFGAGQMGTVLSMAGADLNLMVFSWAQYGYVTLRMDRRGKVYILRRMDMGNERSAFEQKCFYQLFSRRDMVDTRTGSYHRLREAVRMQRSAKELFKTRNALTVRIFRILLAVMGVLSGASFGIVLGNMLDYGWFFMLTLSAAGLICSWQIQFWAEGWFMHYQTRLWMAAAVSVLWLVIGIAVGQFPMALLAVTIQIAGGFLAFFGGRRTEDGRNALGQALRLRRYFAKLTPAQIHKLSRNNPDVFFDLAPFALALGCDGALARCFGSERLSDCPYIQVAEARGMTAKQWSQTMRSMLGSMSAQQRRNPMDGFRSVMDNYMK